MFGVVRPGCGIARDVSADSVQGFFVADDVFEIVSLPYRLTWHVAVLVDAFGCGGFKSRDEGSQ